MIRQIFIGLVAEGTTDVRFLKNVIFKSVQELSWQCETEVDIFDIREIYPNGDSFVEKMLYATRIAQKDYSISMLCIHADSDSRTVAEVMQNKFEPFFEALKSLPSEDYCKCIVPTIPIQMIESWMLADKTLLKSLINAEAMTDVELGLDRAPEAYADPKKAINEAIRIAMEGKPKKRRDEIRISDLYELIGNEVALESLRSIPSFCDFEKRVTDAFRQMNLLHYSGKENDY